MKKKKKKKNVTEAVTLVSTRKRCAVGVCVRRARRRIRLRPFYSCSVRGNFNVWLSLESLKIDTKALRMSRERSNILESSLNCYSFTTVALLLLLLHYYCYTTLCCRRRLNRLQYRLQHRPRDRDRRIAGNVFSLGRICLSSVLNPLVL